MTTHIYIGVSEHTREVFKADSEPTEQSHGVRYGYAIGPFRTMRAARLACNPGAWFSTIAEFERYAKRESERK